MILKRFFSKRGELICQILSIYLPAVRWHWLSAAQGNIFSGPLEPQGRFCEVNLLSCKLFLPVLSQVLMEALQIEVLVSADIDSHSFPSHNMF